MFLKKKLLIVLLLIPLLMPLPLMAIGFQDSIFLLGNFYQDDKWMHTLASEELTRRVEDDWKWEINGSRSLASFMFITGASLVKEYIDTRTGGKWDNNDIAANYIGWLLVHTQIQIKF